MFGLSCSLEVTDVNYQNTSSKIITYSNCKVCDLGTYKLTSKSQDSFYVDRHTVALSYNSRGFSPNNINEYKKLLESPALDQYKYLAIVEENSDLLNIPYYINNGDKIFATAYETIRSPETLVYVRYAYMSFSQKQDYAPGTMQDVPKDYVQVIGYTYNIDKFFELYIEERTKFTSDCSSLTYIDISGKEDFYQSYLEWLPKAVSKKVYQQFSEIGEGSKAFICEFDNSIMPVMGATDLEFSHKVCKEAGGEISVSAILKTYCEKKELFIGNDIYNINCFNYQDNLLSVGDIL